MTEASPGAIARSVMRAADRATLATIMRNDQPEAGAPYASLVLAALDHDASPLLLISTLADHTRNRARFLARHPGAAMYAGFKDFAFYRLDATRAHLVAGFGRIHWIAPGDLLLDVRGSAPLAESEASIIEHMNADHADAVQLYAS